MRKTIFVIGITVTASLLFAACGPIGTIYYSQAPATAAPNVSLPTSVQAPPTENIPADQMTATAETPGPIATAAPNYVAPTNTPAGAAATAAPTALPSTGSASMNPPFVEVNDQTIVNGTVTVASVGSVGPGWIVIHADNNGAPGAILGETAVLDGVNTNVVVKIDTSKATMTLWAMLHTDAGTIGTFEFAGGPDVPVTQNGSIVQQSFMAMP
jgi:hypothetical protein